MTITYTVTQLKGIPLWEYLVLIDGKRSVLGYSCAYDTEAQAHAAARREVELTTRLYAPRLRREEA